MSAFNRKLIATVAACTIAAFISGSAYGQVGVGAGADVGGIGAGSGVSGGAGVSICGSGTQAGGGLGIGGASAGAGIGLGETEAASEAGSASTTITGTSGGDPGITAAVAGMSNVEITRAKRTCDSILADQNGFDEGLVGLCQALAAR